jgi:hypothetical protein
MEFQQQRQRMVKTFLVRFDAIFTLNQDVLLEHHYLPHIALEAPQKWTGPQLPGMRRIPNPETFLNDSWARQLWVPDPANLHVQDRYQPYFKLHGSSNWRDAEGGHLVVMGGHKVSTIASQAVLSWSFERFREYLNTGDTRLMVIGYGFRDMHVNEELINAVERSNLRFFVIDYYGSDVVRHANPSFGGAIYGPNSLDDAFKTGLVGASARGLSETFGGDLLSHDHVLRFFR